MARGILCVDLVMGDIELVRSTCGVSSPQPPAPRALVAGVLVVSVQGSLLRCGVALDKRLVTLGSPGSCMRRLLTEIGVWKRGGDRAISRRGDVQCACAKPDSLGGDAGWMALSRAAVRVTEGLRVGIIRDGVTTIG